MRFFNSRTLSGFTINPFSPTISGSEDLLDTITGVPHFIDSSGGSPNPSYFEGKTKTSAPLYNKGSSSYGIKFNTLIFFSNFNE